MRIFIIRLKIMTKVLTYEYKGDYIVKLKVIQINTKDKRVY